MEFGYASSRDISYISQRPRCLTPEGVNLGDFKADNSNIGRDGHVAVHH
jgi:hypothetical protein